MTIEVATGAAKTVMVDGVDIAATFQWTPDSKRLAALHTDPYAGIRVYRTDGRVHRTLRKVGHITGDDSYSPSGKQLLTVCPPTYRESGYCLWDDRSGKLATRITFNFAATYGWWDDRHLISQVDDDGTRIVVIDLKGKVVRVLARLTVKPDRWISPVYHRAED